jgi:hypothetical protein
MPDLSNLVPLRSRLMLRIFLPQKRTAKELIVEQNFIRLTDKTVREYEQARALIGQQMHALEHQENGLALPFIDFPDHMEDCINAAGRLCSLIEKLEEKALPSSEAVTESIASHGLDPTERKRIRDVRDTIEHLAGKLQGGQVEVGHFIALAPNNDGDGLVIGRLELKFEDLADAIRRLHKIAHDIVSQL